ncbi:hypothetical protein [uncultured Leifsonia sp.]|uniref:hypothetical protein n=1 Tax=uncultured Leifsonia sp. TaxID=340359 RepID=UPI0028D1A4F5|nr:hypothetical protein [uncultured Leifsonia sp.]
MTTSDPLAAVRGRRWSAPLGWSLLAVAAVLIVVAPMTAAVPSLPSVLSVIAGFAIGIGYQFQPFLHRSGPRTPNRVLAGWLVAASAAMFVSAVLVVVVGWTSRPGGLGLVLLAGSVALLLVGLTERYPTGSNLPGLFLFPVGLDGLMIQTLAPRLTSPAEAAIALALFVPATGAAVVLTVWAFSIRSVARVMYVKATESARGVLWAWALLVVGVLVWNGLGVAFTDGEWANPVVWALPIVTVGSVLAAATTGWSSYVEARAQLHRDAG